MHYVKKTGTGNGRTIHVGLTSGYTLCGMQTWEMVESKIPALTCGICAVALDDLLDGLVAEAEEEPVEVRADQD